MKRLILLLLVASVLLLGQVIINCSRPLDTDGLGPDPNPDPNKRDTVYIYDTSYIFDTVFSIDTIFGEDTTYIYDTIVTIDTIFSDDTTYVYDTVFHGDTIIIVDTIINYDTIFAGDTIIIVDTLLNYDTLFVTDTIVNNDTIILIDTITEFDTITIYDTIYDTVVDTITDTDTIIVVDTLVISPTYCASLSNAQKQIVWLLQNHPGLYQLDFVASGDESDPKDKLVVEINGVKFFWKPFEEPQMLLTLDLEAGTKVVIYSATPHAYGHSIDICLKVEEL